VLDGASAGRLRPAYIIRSDQAPGAAIALISPVVGRSAPFASLNAFVDWSVAATALYERYISMNRSHFCDVA